MSLSLNGFAKRRGLGLAVFVCATVLAGSSLAADPKTESCALMVKLNGETQVVPAAGVAVMTAPGRLTLPKADGQVTGVVCDRDSLTPALGDERVLTQLKLPLYIRSGGRILVLEAANGMIQVRMREGRPTKDEIPELQNRMNDLQLAANAAAKS